MCRPVLGRKEHLSHTSLRTPGPGTQARLPRKAWIRPGVEFSTAARALPQGGWSCRPFPGTASAQGGGPSSPTRALESFSRHPQAGGHTGPPGARLTAQAPAAVAGLG